MNEKGWAGMDWDGLGWTGMGWDGLGWTGMGWDALGCNQMGHSEKCWSRGCLLIQMLKCQLQIFMP